MSNYTAMCGDGTLTERRPGYYEYKVYYTDMFGQTKRKAFAGRDINELYMKAEEFLQKEEEKGKGIEIDSTIPEILRRRYEFDFAKHYINEPGYSRNINSLKKIERSFIGKVPIVELTERDLERYIHGLTSYSNSVIGKTYGQLKLAYKEAMNAGIVKNNLMEHRNLRCPKSVKQDAKVMAFTIEEQEIFVKGLMDHKVRATRNDYRKQLLIELYTGMRMGEVNALRPKDIDFKRNVIHVRGTISIGINHRIYRSERTKTKAGMRDVPMNDLVKPVLKEALEEIIPNPAGTVFYDHHKDNVISTSQVCSFYRRMCEKCGLQYYGQHSLRHTFATRCIEAGIQPVVLKTWLGHTNIHITLDTYSDVFDSLNNDSINVFESYINNNSR